mmetsp:Transcript_32575/g.71915  ORF Transcript_32575/g.71915 Transcript_32575/m.71915 type:complete len:254 (+) Transcript_32575:187-948(+)
MRHGRTSHPLPHLQLHPCHMNGTACFRQVLHRRQLASHSLASGHLLGGGAHPPILHRHATCAAAACHAHHLHEHAPRPGRHHGGPRGFAAAAQGLALAALEAGRAHQVEEAAPLHHPTCAAVPHPASGGALPDVGHLVGAPRPIAGPATVAAHLPMAGARGLVGRMAGCRGHGEVAVYPQLLGVQALDLSGGAATAHHHHLRAGLLQAVLVGAPDLLRDPQTSGTMKKSHLRRVRLRARMARGRTILLNPAAA